MGWLYFLGYVLTQKEFRRMMLSRMTRKDWGGGIIWVQLWGWLAFLWVEMDRAGRRPLKWLGYDREGTVCNWQGPFGWSTGAGGHLSCWSPADSTGCGNKIADRSGLEINLEESLAWKWSWKLVFGFCVWQKVWQAEGDDCTSGVISAGAEYVERR